MMLRIDIGGVEILGHPTVSTPRVEGLYVAPDGFDGWDDGPEVRRESSPLLGAHGDADLPVLNGSRVISIDGHALAWSESELAELREQVMGVGADGAPVRLAVEHQGVTLWADVRRGAKPTFKDAGVRHGMLRARFAVFLVTANPRKYGELRAYKAGETATHRGNFPASPVLVVQGPRSAGYTVSAGAFQFTVTAPLAAGSKDEIDMSTGWVRRDGVLLIGGIARADTWRIPPGPAGLVHTITGTSASMTVLVTDTSV